MRRRSRRGEGRIPRSRRRTPERTQNTKNPTPQNHHHQHHQPTGSPWLPHPTIPPSCCDPARCRPPPQIPCIPIEEAEGGGVFGFCFGCGCGFGCGFGGGFGGCGGGGGGGGGGWLLHLYLHAHARAQAPAVGFVVNNAPAPTSSPIPCPSPPPLRRRRCRRLLRPPPRLSDLLLLRHWLGVLAGQRWQEEAYSAIESPSGSARGVQQYRTISECQIFS